MSQQILDQSRRLSGAIVITGTGRSRAFKLAEGYPETQAAISRPNSTLIDITSTLHQEYMKLHPATTNARDISLFILQITTELQRTTL